MALGKLKVRRIEVNGKLRPGVYAKDVILHIISTLGVNGGTGFAYEYAGEVFDRFSMEERMTVCNMSIRRWRARGLCEPGRDDIHLPEGPALFAEAGSRVGRGRRPVRRKGVASDPGCAYDDVVRMDAADIAPGSVTLGNQPGGRGIPITGSIPDPLKAKGTDERGLNRGGACLHEAEARRAHQGDED